MTKLKLGIQLYSLRKYLKRAEDVRGVFERVRGIGAEVVQISHMCEIDGKELLEISRDTNLPICITHADFGRIKGDLDRLAEEHLSFGCKNIGIGMMPAEYRKSEDGISRFIEFLNATSEKLEKYGMTVSYHNHNFEFKETGGKRTMDRLIDETARGVLFIPDTFWIKAGGFEPTVYLDKMDGRVNTVHLKDYKKTIIPVFKAIGDGVLDFKKILKKCEDIGAQNAVVELDAALNMYKSLDKSMKYLKTIY